MKPGLEAVFSTDVAIPKSFRIGDHELLDTLKLHRAGSRLVNGCFEVETAHPSPLTVRLSDLEEDVLAKLTGGWIPGAAVVKTTELSPLQILEVLSGPPLGRLELNHVRGGGASFDKVIEARKDEVKGWIARYRALQGNSPTGRPALEALGREIARQNRQFKRHEAGFVTPDQVRALMGGKCFEALKSTGVIQF